MPFATINMATPINNTHSQIFILPDPENAYSRIHEVSNKKYEILNWIKVVSCTFYHRINYLLKTLFFSVSYNVNYKFLLFGRQIQSKYCSRFGNKCITRCNHTLSYCLFDFLFEFLQNSKKDGKFSFRLFT